MATLLVFAVVELAWRRADRITDDWQGWRQADTQAIARNLAFEEFDPTSPRIDWRGDGPGYVEAELPLYPALIALALRAGGDRVWPGQLLSLLCVLAAAALLYAALARRFGEPAGYLALLAVLSGQGAIVIATAIQPDPLALLAFTVGWLAFVAYLQAPRRKTLALWVIATMIAGLVKPTTLELGLAQGLLCLLAHRRALRDPRLWLGWLLVLVAIGAYLWHARQLYLTYGNTFGVLSGGDSKLPSLERLSELTSWLELGRYAVVWGLGWPGFLAALLLLSRRRLGAEELALAGAAFALCVLAFRYTAGPFGTHYHLPHAVLGAWLVARAVAELWPPRAVPRAAPQPTPTPAPMEELASAEADDVQGRDVDARTVHARDMQARDANARDLHARDAEARDATSTPALRRALAIVLVLASLAQAARAARFVRRLPPQPETELGLRLAELAPAGARIVVRARAEAYSREWQTVNNFEDPRVFWLSHTHGWVLPNDLAGVAATARLDELRRRGARYYVHVRQIEPDAALRAWLADHAELRASSRAGEIYELRSK